MAKRKKSASGESLGRFLSRPWVQRDPAPCLSSDLIPAFGGRRNRFPFGCSESFDVSVRMKEMNSTGFETQDAKNLDTVLAPASVITSVNHPPSAADAQDLEVEANELVEPSTG